MISGEESGIVEQLHTQDQAGVRDVIPGSFCGDLLDVSESTKDTCVCLSGYVKQKISNYPIFLVATGLFRNFHFFNDFSTRTAGK